MATIQSNIGLVTGMAIGDTVDALMQLAAKPRDLLAERTNELAEKQVAFTELSAYLYSVRLLSDNLGKSELFDSRSATSSNENILTVSAGDDTPVGVYQFTSVRLAQNQQLLSHGVADEDTSLGGGDISFRFGDDVLRSVSLSNFNAGEGIQRGMIRITDRSGASTHIDLSTVQTVGDILDAINDNTQINVTAVARGDGFRLIDNTGQSVSNLMVQEVSGGTTAASLGLDKINVADAVADGQDVISLYEDLRLADLNDGNGLTLSEDYLADIYYELRDGTTASIDLSPLGDGQSLATMTLGDVLELINAADPDKLSATIAPDGDRLIVTDLTSDLLGVSLDTTYEPGNNGTGVISQVGSMGVTSGGSESQAASLSIQFTGDNNDLLIEVGQNGADYNGIEVILVDNAGGTDEATAQYDAENKKLTVSINQGVTTASTVAAAVAEEFSFNLTSAYDSTALAGLGLAGEAVDGVISGRRILGGAQSVLLSSLNGGNGYGPLGTLELTDRSGASDTVDLSAAETLEELIDAINAAAVDIVATVNDAKNGILLNDQSGASASNMIVASGPDGLQTAELLSIAVDDAIDSVASGDMHLQVVCENTKLTALNGGNGVASGDFKIVSSDGRYDDIDLNSGSIETVGDLIDAVNHLDIGVVAEINATGDGLLIRDTADGGGQLQIIEGSGTTAADLHLLGETVEVEHDGQTYQAIDGSTTITITLQSGDSLADLCEMINELDAGISAAVFNDGSSQPYRLSINSELAGEQGRLIVDTSALGLSFAETAQARDALLVYGSPENLADGVLVSSSSNTFSDMLPGLELEIKGVSDQAVTVDVQRSAASALANMEALVENYNRFRENLNALTEFNEQTDEAALLCGDRTALRLDVDMSQLLSGRFFGATAIQSLAEVGLDLQSDGTLSFDADKFSQLFDQDADALATFFAGTPSGDSCEDYGIIIEEVGTGSSTAYTNSITTITIDHDLLNARFAEDPQAVMAYLRGLIHGGTLEEFGISVGDSQVQIDANIFRSKYLSDEIFADNLKPQTSGGVSNMFAQTIEKLAGEDTSLMARRLFTLNDKIDVNQARLERMDKMLDLQEERLYTQFYNMEIAIGKLQSNLSVLETINTDMTFYYDDDDR